MSLMFFYDEPPPEFLIFRQKAQRLEQEHLETRKALFEAEVALRAAPGDPGLQGRVEELKKKLAELDKQAPWISSYDDTPVEIALWGVPHG